MLVILHYLRFKKLSGKFKCKQFLDLQKICIQSNHLGSYDDLNEMCANHNTLKSMDQFHVVFHYTMQNCNTFYLIDKLNCLLICFKSLIKNLIKFAYVWTWI